MSVHKPRSLRVSSHEPLLRAEEGAVQSAAGDDLLEGPPTPRESESRESSEGDLAAGTFEGEREPWNICPGWCPEPVSTVGKMAYFVVSCTVSLVVHAMPVFWAVADGMSHALLFLLASWKGPRRYTFREAVGDIVAIAELRAGMQLAGAATGSRQNQHWPLALVSVVTCAATLAVGALKAALFRYGEGEPDWLAPALFVLSGTFAPLHVMFACARVGSARRVRLTQMMVPLARRRSSAGVKRDPETGIVLPARNGDLDPDLPAERLADPDSRFIRLRRGLVHYKVDGEYVNRRAILFLHGFGAGAFAWRKIAPQLAKELGVRSFSVDRPGSGLSVEQDPGDGDSESAVSFREQAAACLELLAREGVEEVAIVGHSDGALVALLAAQMAQQSSAKEVPKVRSLAFVSPSMTREHLPTSTRLMLNSSLPLALLRPLLRSEVSELATRRAWRDAATVPRNLVGLYRKNLHVRGWDKALTDLCRLGRDISSSDLTEALKDVSSLPIKTIAGDSDRISPMQKVRFLASQLPGSQMVVLSHCGHLPHEECPDALVSHLTHFLLASFEGSDHDTGSADIPAPKTPEVRAFADPEGFINATLGLSHSWSSPSVPRHRRTPS